MKTATALFTEVIVSRLSGTVVVNNPQVLSMRFNNGISFSCQLTLFDAFTEVCTVGTPNREREREKKESESTEQHGLREEIGKTPQHQKPTLHAGTLCENQCICSSS